MYQKEKKTLRLDYYNVNINNILQHAYQDMTFRVGNTLICETAVSDTHIWALQMLARQCFPSVMTMTKQTNKPKKKEKNAVQQQQQN